MSCRKEKVIFLQMGNMKSNLSNNVLDLLLQKSYIPASNFSTCFATTIVNKRTLENTEWEILHSNKIKYTILKKQQIKQKIQIKDSLHRNMLPGRQPQKHRHGFENQTGRCGKAMALEDRRRGRTFPSIGAEYALAQNRASTAESP